MKIQHKTYAAGMRDEDIVALYWQRDENAIKQTDIKYGAYLMTIARNILRDLRDCEECLNDTYLGAWNAMPPQRPTLLQAFLASIMRRTAIDCYRANTREKRVPTDAIDSFDELEYVVAGGEHPAKQAEAAQLTALISDYVRALPRRCKYVFMARYYVVRPISDIAQALSCSEATVNRDIARIRDELRALLGKEGYLC